MLSYTFTHTIVQHGHALPCFLGAKALQKPTIMFNRSYSTALAISGGCFPNYRGTHDLPLLHVMLRHALRFPARLPHDFS